MNSFITNEGKTIYYKVVDNYSEKVRAVKGVEKTGRYIYFYDEKQNLLKWKRIYGEYDEMQNVSTIMAKELYEKN